MNQPPIPSTSPLSEVDPAAMNELMARDPLELTDQDINSIVVQLRAQRILWEKEETKAKRTGTRANAKKALAPAEVSALLANLELDI